MKIKHQELVIDKNDPFLNCKLERKKYGQVLTEVVNTYSEGFVLAINNEWGTGKTTFVKMWQQHLINEGFQTIYFNAWENDFDNNPLVALISELSTLINGHNKKQFKSVVAKGAVLVKHIVPSMLKSFAEKHIGNLDQIVADGIENTAKAATEILEEELKEYAKKKKTILEFRKELESFVVKDRESYEEAKPLVFIIDELDRCRPHYAVEVLEQMKHFFSVPGIVFALSIDKNHLASSVKGFYGSEEINTEEYLRRFIDLEYSIPKPPASVFSKYLFEYFSFRDFFFSIKRKEYGDFHGDADSFLQMADILFTKTEITLRQQEKIFGQTRLILNSFKYNQYIFSHLLFVLVFIKIMKNELYRKINAFTLSVQELSDAFSDLVIIGGKQRETMNPVYIQALLLYFYNSSLEYNSQEELFEVKEGGVYVSLIKSKLENEKRFGLAACFADIRRSRYSDVALNYLLNRINLTGSVVIQ